MSRPAPAVDLAKAWLAERLAAGPRAVQELAAEAADAGMAERTWKRARRALGVVATRRQGRWWLALPRPGSHGPEAPLPEDLRAIAHELGAEELRVLALLARRLRQGQRQYGALDLRRDGRDFEAERGEEVQDLIVYTALAELRRLVRSEPARTTAHSEARGAVCRAPQDGAEGARSRRRVRAARDRLHSTRVHRLRAYAAALALEIREGGAL